MPPNSKNNLTLPEVCNKKQCKLTFCKMIDEHFEINTARCKKHAIVLPSFLHLMALTSKISSIIARYFICFLVLCFIFFPNFFFADYGDIYLKSIDENFYLI